MITVHADIVGSLLRPPELPEAQKRLAAGSIGADEFKRVEDRPVDEAVGLQESVGLPGVTDGEMRRSLLAFPLFSLTNLPWTRWGS